MSNNKPTDSVHEENYRAEYREIAAGWRFFASLRFIVAAFTIPVQSALFTLYQQRASTSKTVSVLSEKLLEDASIVAIVGILSVIAIMIIEWRTVGLIKLFLGRAVELEFRLGLLDGHFHRLRDPVFMEPSGLKIILTHTGGLFVIYLSMLIMWYMLFFSAL